MLAFESFIEHVCADFSLDSALHNHIPRGLVLTQAYITIAGTFFFTY